MELTQDQLKQLLSYDAETGLLVWKKSPRSRVKVGDVAGCLTAEGYVIVSIAGKLHKAHRLAWLYTHGVWPALIDHVNGQKQDNRLANLRVATPQENAQNRRTARKGTSSGLLGVYLSNNGKSFSARLRIGCSQRHLGTFKTAEEAHQAYLCAKRVHHVGNTL